MSCASRDSSNAFLPDGPEISGASEGPLQGLTFAAKDLYDVCASLCCVDQIACWRQHEACIVSAEAIILLAALQSYIIFNHSRNVFKRFVEVNISTVHLGFAG